MMLCGQTLSNVMGVKMSNLLCDDVHHSRYVSSPKFPNIMIIFVVIPEHQSRLITSESHNSIEDRTSTKTLITLCNVTLNIC